MDDVVDGGVWPEEGGVVYVELFAPCLPEVEFLPSRQACDLAFHSFYSRELASRSLEHIRKRFPDARMLMRRIPLNLSLYGDLEEYNRHVVAARREAAWLGAGSVARRLQALPDH